MDSPAQPVSRFIDTPAALSSLGDTLRDQPWIALDTEFIREDTYFPKLCLIQVAIPGLIACIDALTLTRLDPLLERLHDPAVTKVLHASHQDMEIFFHLCAEHLPAPLFDTQLAAALLGWPGQASYATLVADTFGVTLNKALSRTDWSRRPLAVEQLEYAADDVRYLGPLHLELRQRLAGMGRLEWLDEDCVAFIDPARYRHPPQTAWQRIRGAHRLSESQRRILQSLASWRETEARNRDRPRGWLLSDEALLEISRLRPADPDQLLKIKTLSRRTVERDGRTLLGLVDAAREAGADRSLRDAAVRGGPPTPDEKSLLRQMTELVRRRAAELSIDPAMLAARRDLVALLRGDRPVSLLQGWRSNVVGAELLELLPGSPPTAS